MGVPLSKRGLSAVEFYYKATVIHDKIVQFLIRDFGVKSISRDLKTFTHNAKMSKNDRELFTALCTKYKIDTESDWPVWVIDHYRKWILHCLMELLNNITQAYSIFPAEPYFEFEVKLKRTYQHLAISSC